MVDSSDPHGLPLWPAPERNKGPLGELLRAVLPATGTLLEIASGTGQHAAHFARVLPGYTIQPTDCDPEHLATLRRRVAHLNEPRVLTPFELDVTRELPALTVTAVFCANLVHIAPWAAAVGLFRVAAHVLHAGGTLVTDGPYSFHGEHTAESNARFDQSLRERNPDWGVRDAAALPPVARAHGFVLAETRAQPANNFALVWQRTGGGPSAWELPQAFN